MIPAKLYNETYRGSAQKQIEDVISFLSPLIIDYWQNNEGFDRQLHSTKIEKWSLWRWMGQIFKSVNKQFTGSN